LETENHASTHGAADYGAIVATSERVAWTVDEIFRDRRFDASRRIVPDSWVDTYELPFLNAQEQLLLNHIRAFSYAHLFGNFEEFIPLHLVEIAERDWHDDRAHLRALFRFGDEEMKHQELMLRAESVLEASCGHTFGRYFDPEKHRIAEFTQAVLSYPPLPRFLLLAALEWGTQRHYVESVKDHAGESCDPLYVDLLQNHWVEESQHIRTDVLEIERMARAMSAEELSAAFDHVLGLAGLVDATFVGQVGQELATFLRLTGRQLSEPEAAALSDALCKSMRAIFAGVGLSHPSFKRLVMDLSKEGAAKLGIT
jgi:hypothetical protein